ncbi:MAG: LysR family transcriptional regulator [Cellulosilyticaceae bacterium]
MTIRHLKIFIAVAECGKMGVAAEKLFISQPSVSQAIKEIEEHYNVKLFERLSRKLYITESGELLLRYARYIIQSFDEMERQLKYTGEHVSLRIGATITVGTCMLEPIIAAFETKHSDIKTKVVVNNSDEIQQMLLKSQLDVGIIEGDIEHKDLDKFPICKDSLVLAVGKKHPLYEKRQIKVETLEGEALICREKGSGVRKVFDKLLEDYQISMPIKWDCTNTEAIKRAAIGGQGIAVFSEQIIEEEIKNEALHIVTLEGVSLSREICVVLHKNKFLSHHLKSFLEEIRTMVMRD